jgi:hypothetical protein
LQKTTVEKPLDTPEEQMTFWGAIPNHNQKLKEIRAYDGILRSAHERQTEFQQKRPFGAHGELPKMEIASERIGIIRGRIGIIKGRIGIARGRLEIARERIGKTREQLEVATKPLEKAGKWGGRQRGQEKPDAVVDIART